MVHVLSYVCMLIAVSACLWCCQKDEASPCEPYLLHNQSTIPLSDGRPCIYGFCNKVMHYWREPG